MTEDRNTALRNWARHDLYASSSEHRVLLIAASLVNGTPIKLSHVLLGLDRSNQRRVVECVARAVGLTPSI